MSSYLKWTKHPETGHWHEAAWLDNYFGEHLYGVKFNDDKVFDPNKVDLETSEKKPGKDEIIDSTRSLRKEILGGKGVKDKVEEAAKAKVEKWRVRVLVINPTDFLYLFTTGLKVHKGFQIISGVPDDAKVIAVNYDNFRHKIIMTVQSEEYKEIPTTEMPPFVAVEINVGKSKGKNYKKPRKRR